MILIPGHVGWFTFWCHSHIWQTCKLLDKHQRDCIGYMWLSPRHFQFQLPVSGFSRSHLWGQCVISKYQVNNWNANTMGMQRRKMIKMPVDTHFAGEFANMLITKLFPCEIRCCFVLKHIPEAKLAVVLKIWVLPPFINFFNL